MTIKEELCKIKNYSEKSFYRVAMINKEKVLSTFEGASVSELMSGKSFASTIRFRSRAILGSTILFFLSDDEATLCPRKNYI